MFFLTSRPCACPICSLAYSLKCFWAHFCECSCVCVQWTKHTALRPNWCVFQEEWGGPVGCQETKFEFSSCYTVLCVSCLYLCPSVSSPGAIFLFALIGYTFGDLSPVLLLNFFVDTYSSPAPTFPAVSCRSCCSVTVRMQQLLLNVLCSTLLLLAVMPSVYSQSGMGPSSFLFHFFLLLDHLSAFWCVSIHSAPDISSFKFRVFPWFFLFLFSFTFFLL